MHRKTSSQAAPRKKRTRTTRSSNAKTSPSKRPRAGKAEPSPRVKPRIGRTRPKARRIRRILVWEPTPEAKKIIDACQDVFDNVSGAKSDCNKFVKAVGDKFSANPFGAGDDADVITTDIRDSTWLSDYGWTGLDDPVKAKVAADTGELVIAGATGADLNQNHGHVVVVVSSEKLWKDFPYASWGTLGGVGKTNAKMTLAYKLADLPKVSYMSKKV